MGVFDKQIETAKTLISKYGQAVTWKSVTNGSPVDLSQPWKPSSSVEVLHNVEICFVSKTDLRSQKFLSYLTGTEVPKIALTGLMGSVTFEPKIKDVVIREGVELTIKDFEILNPNGQKILYILEFEA